MDESPTGSSVADFMFMGKGLNFKLNEIILQVIIERIWQIIS